MILSTFIFSILIGKNNPFEISSLGFSSKHKTERRTNPSLKSNFNHKARTKLEIPWEKKTKQTKMMKVLIMCLDVVLPS